MSHTKAMLVAVVVLCFVLFVASAWLMCAVTDQYKPACGIQMFALIAGGFISMYFANEDE